MGRSGTLDQEVEQDGGEEDDTEWLKEQENRLRKYERLLDRHAKEGLKLPAGATYQHTVMRVTTMTEPALSRRCDPAFSTFYCLFTAFPFLFTVFSLSFLDLPLPFHCLSIPFHCLFTVFP